MKLKICVFSLFVCTLTSSLTFAQLESLPSCSSIDLKKQSLGTTCITSKRVEFKRVSIRGKLGVQDSRSARVWFDLIKKNVNHYEATGFCRLFPASNLPSVGDFLKAEDHGLREVFNGDMSNQTFWSSKIVNNLEAYAFEGDYLSGDTDIMENRKGYSARCVSQPHPEEWLTNVSAQTN